MNAVGSIKSNFSLATSLANFRMCPYVPKNARRYEWWSLPTPMILPQLLLMSNVWEPGTDISCHARAPWEVVKGAGRDECWFGQSCALFLPEYFPLWTHVPPFTLMDTVSLLQLTGFFIPIWTELMSSCSISTHSYPLAHLGSPWERTLSATTHHPL